MSFRESFYEGLIVAGRPLLHLVAPFNRKVRQGLRGRRVALMRLAEWSFLYRDRERPLVWFHAPSVGEGLMAQAIISALRKRQPDVQVAFTHFSPSAERLAEKLGADVNAYLPWDMRYDVRRALDFLRPSAIAFVRTEVWPVLTREARLRKVHMALVNAVLPEG
jgi:3-deoxy-D-manno-octulosonic-acid transferase